MRSFCWRGGEEFPRRKLWRRGILGSFWRGDSRPCDFAPGMRRGRIRRFLMAWRRWMRGDCKSWPLTPRQMICRLSKSRKSSKKRQRPARKVGRLLNRWKDGGALAAKATYLLRDSMKVLGHSEEFPKPVCGIFFTDPSDPMAGGTGHTIRVCQQESVPVVFQTDWLEWM